LTVKINRSAVEAIESILKRGNDAIVCRRKDTVVVYEESRKIAYRPDSIGSQEGNRSQ